MTSTGEITAGNIVGAGRRFIMRGGYSGFSYADIAEATGLRKASIHHHFPAKSDLAIAVVKQSTDLFNTDMSALDASGASSLDQIKAYIGYWERCISDSSAPFCVAGMLGAELPSLPDDVAAEVRAHFENLSAWLERALEAGAKAKLIKLTDSARAESATLVALIYGAMLTARAFGNAALFKEVTDSAVAKLVRSRKASTSGE